MKISLRDITTTFALSLFIFLNIMTANAQTAAFSYQGKLTDGASAANGSYQMQFALFDASTGGNQIGATQTSAVMVTTGVFTVNLGFGETAFDGTERFLQISVFSIQTNAFVPLTPRQQITSAPYAIKSITAENALNLGGTAASQFVQTNDARLSDARTPLPGSSDYIRTDNSLQAADIYISGAMTANGFDSNSGYLIGGTTVLSVPGTNNLFVGPGAGASTSTGGNNSFVGMETGRFNVAGNYNSFFGRSAGLANTTGSNNTLLGSNTNVGGGNLSFASAIGAGSVVASSNTIVLGRSIGQDTVQVPGILNVAAQYNIGGLRILSTAFTDNVFLGREAGGDNTAAGNSNVFVGSLAGRDNTSGSQNSFFGNRAGLSTTTGGGNSFFGRSAGQFNTIGFENSFFGQSAGSANTTGNNNSFFGRSAGLTNTIGTFNSFFGSLTGDSNTSGTNNTFIGAAAGSANTSGNSNTFVGLQAGEGNTTGDQNAFFGNNAGITNTTGSLNTYLGFNARGSAGITNATAIGANAFVNLSNQIMLGTDSNIVLVPGALSINSLRIAALASSGITAVCRNALNDLATCSSSIRYKTNVANFDSGLSLVNRLRPVTFNWKSDGSRDLGLVAEEVAEVDGLLVIRNEKGETEGVKYDRLGVVLINAVKEQQAQIESLKQQIERLKKLVCAGDAQAEACKE